MTAAVTEAARTPSRVSSREAKRLFADLMGVPPEIRRGGLRGLAHRDLVEVLTVAAKEGGTPYCLYQDDPQGFVEDILQETTWSKQNAVLNSIPDNRRVAVPSAFGTGKCVWERDRIPLADGRMVEARDLVGQRFLVMTWDERTGQQVARTARAEWNAVEPVYRVRTTGGREIVRNAEHPLWAARAVSTVEGGRAKGTVTLTPEVRGWTPVGDLAVGDLALVPERHDAQGYDRQPGDHVTLLGYLLGDGGTTSSQITFTQQDGEALDEFRSLVNRLGCDLIAKANRPYHYRIAGRLRPGDNPRLRARANPVLELVRQWGLYGKGARDKAFPDWAWTLPNAQLAVLLGRLFACDGYVYVREGRGRLQGTVGITLASERMIRDVEHAMLRLGVWGTVRHRTVRTGGESFDAWEWATTDRACVYRLADTLDVPGKDARLRDAAVRLAARSTSRTHSWPTRNAPAGYRWERVTMVEKLPRPERTVAIEVEDRPTFVTSFVEHNTHIAARAVVWRGSVHPPGTSLTVTTATRFRQVRRQLWPHIRAIHKRAGLPGQVDQTQWAAPNYEGVMVDIAYGFSAPPHDESAVQGIHAPKLFIVVDEAGGIGRIIGGAMRGLLTGEDTRLLAIGNPPTDDEGSWFEGLCTDPDVCVIPIAAWDSPQLSGETVGPCRACPESVPEHSLASHLVDREWVDETIGEHGRDAPYVIAKVDAKFPKGGPRRAIPSTWVELAVEAPEPEDGDPDFDEHVRLCDLDLASETEEWHVKRGAWIRLGVDVAADGGDEFVVSRSVGNLGTIRHIASGAANANHLDVSGEVLREIKEAEALAEAIGSTSRIHVKVDVIGLGWGVVGTLTAWGSEGLHSAKIVGVDVRENTHREPDAETLRPARKRDELWLAGRSLLTPTGPGEPGLLRLRVDRRTQAQLSSPMMGTNSGGMTVIEAKSSMKSRGLPSPDRAEALLLALYEPIIKPKRKQARLIV